MSNIILHLFWRLFVAEMGGLWPPKNVPFDPRENLVCKRLFAVLWAIWAIIFTEPMKLYF
jgi:hypothetical protein